MFEKEKEILRSKIKQSKSIAIFGHENIDWDSLGSWLAIWRVCEKLGKDVKYFTPKEISKKLRFVKWWDKYNCEFDFLDYDLLIFVDTPSAKSQLSKFWLKDKNYWDLQYKILIDHHISSNLYANLNIVDPNRSSTCDLMYEIIKDLWPDLIDIDIANYLLLGHLTDTNFCKWDSAWYKEIFLAGELVKLWWDKNTVLQNIYYNSSYNAIKFVWELINRIRFKEDIVYTYYTDDELKQRWLDREDVDFVMDLMLKISDKKIYILFRKEGDNIKWSIRTRYPWANILAEKLGWWWHAKAAWFKIKIVEDFNSQIEGIIDSLIL